MGGPIPSERRIVRECKSSRGSRATGRHVASARPAGAKKADAIGLNQRRDLNGQVRAFRQQACAVRNRRGRANRSWIADNDQFIQQRKAQVMPEVANASADSPEKNR